MNQSPRPRPVGQHPAPAPKAPATLPQAGDVLLLTREDSVQFVTPMLFRVIRVHDWPTYAGWVWLDGYQLDDARQAVRRRSLFVRTGGLRLASATGTAGCAGSQRGRRRPRVESGEPANRACGRADPRNL